MKTRTLDPEVIVRDGRPVAEILEETAGGLEPPPPEPCLLAADVTQEGLAARLAEQGGRLAVFDTEGSVFSIALGRYTAGSSNFEVLLRGWSADSLRVDRKGSSPIRVERPVLTVCITLQPEVLRRLGEKRETVTQGLMSRFLFAIPDSRVGSRVFVHRPVAEAARARYQAAVGRVLHLPTPALAGPTATPWRVLRLEGEGLDARSRFYDTTERAMAPGGRLEGIADWGGKIASNVARIGALFHALEAHPEPWASPVGLTAVEAAVRIGEHLQEHALAAYQVLGADATTALALRAWETICRHRWRSFSLRQLYRSLGEAPKAVQPALELLLERGYLRTLPPPPRERGRRGQAPSPQYEVRPEALNTASTP